MIKQSGKNSVMEINRLLAGFILSLCALCTTTSYAQRGEADRNLPVFPATTPQLYNAFLLSVPDIQAETTVGHLPRLPRFVKGVYSNNFAGSGRESDLAGTGG